MSDGFSFFLFPPKITVVKGCISSFSFSLDSDLVDRPTAFTAAETRPSSPFPPRPQKRYSSKLFPFSFPLHLLPWESDMRNAHLPIVELLSFSFFFSSHSRPARRRRCPPPPLPPSPTFPAVGVGDAATVLASSIFHSPSSSLFPLFSPSRVTGLQFPVYPSLFLLVWDHRPFPLVEAFFLPAPGMAGIAASLPPFFSSLCCGRPVAAERTVLGLKDFLFFFLFSFSQPETAEPPPLSPFFLLGGCEAGSVLDSAPFFFLVEGHFLFFSPPYLLCKHNAKLTPLQPMAFPLFPLPLSAELIAKV